MTKNKIKLYRLYYYGNAEELYLTFKPTRKEIIEIGIKKHWFHPDDDDPDETEMFIQDTEVTRVVVYDK